MWNIAESWKFGTRNYTGSHKATRIFAEPTKDAE
jgi:hypothetical protein